MPALGTAKDRFGRNKGAKPGGANETKPGGAKPGGAKPRRPSTEGVSAHCAHLE